MEDVKIILSGLWVATMLVFLWGDVLSIIAGDAEKMFADQTQMTQAMWMGIAILMLIPIVLIVLSLTLPHHLDRWMSVIAAVFWLGFNLLSLGGYPTYEKILFSCKHGIQCTYCLVCLEVGLNRKARPKEDTYDSNYLYMIQATGVS